MTDRLEAFAKKYLIRYGGDSLEGIFVRADGARVWDANGREILDFTSGQMCATIGHNHPAIVEAIRHSTERAIHFFSGMIPDSVSELAHRLAGILPRPLSRSLFVNTGSESNEAAIRMAKLVTDGYEVVALGGSWHGVTGASSAASFASDRHGYGPTMPGVFVLPEPNAYRCPVDHCLRRCDHTCLRVGLRMFDMQSVGAPAAVIAEPIISAGGVIVPPEGYFAELRQACDDRGMKLIFDEAQTAFGRIGAWSAAEKINVTPDIMTVSKTLGGGIPLAGVVTSDEVEETAHSRGFNFYTSHVADPMPAAVGLAVIDVIDKENLRQRALEQGDYLRRQLEILAQRHEAIDDIRGDGLLIGVELVKDRDSREPHHELGALTTSRCFELGLSMNIRRRPERGSVWRIAPPITVTRDEIDRAVAILDQSLSESVDQLARDD